MIGGLKCTHEETRKLLAAYHVTSRPLSSSWDNDDVLIRARPTLRYFLPSLIPQEMDEKINSGGMIETPPSLSLSFSLEYFSRDRKLKLFEYTLERILSECLRIQRDFTEISL